MKKIKAEKGKYITQSNDVGDERIFITEIKGMNVNESDWRDATEEEKEAFDKYLEDKRKEEEK